MSIEMIFWLIALGFVVGTVGTLIGAGGGFVLVPVLLLMYPTARPETITSISLAVVFVNALSGSWAYARMKRIDYRTGWLFAAATVPGALIGALSTDYIPRGLFNLILGALMILASIYLMYHRQEKSGKPGLSGGPLTQRRVVDAAGTTHTYSFDAKVGLWLSLLVGYISSALGIGGGIVHVPILVRVLNFPIHVATSTSHFILAIMALTGTLVHIANGSFAHGGLRRTICLGVGVLIGAQLGALLSTRVKSSWIIRGLALALGLVGLRLLILTLS